MTLCSKCIIGGILQNGSSFASDLDVDADSERVPFHLEFFFDLDTDDERSQGRRQVQFDGVVVEGTIVDGVIRGTLSGNFDVEAKRETEAEATVETFSRRGVLALLTVTVEDADQRTYFSANIRPALKFVDPVRALNASHPESNLRGTVFLGWDNPERGLTEDSD